MNDERIPVNDGGGLYDNCGLCETLLSDLNSLPKLAISGQYLQFCAIITGMAQKLINLKKGIKSDLDSKDEIIEELKRINNNLLEEKNGLPVGKD